jgi:hypothetical protein
MSSSEHLDAARRLACSLRAATALHWRDLKEAKALIDELK